MALPVRLRPDFTAAKLRLLARHAGDANQTRRLLALAAIYDGGPRGDAALVGGVGLQIMRDWVMRFNAEGPDGLINHKAPGASSRLNDEQRQRLMAVVESGPIPAVHGVVRWRLVDLAQWVWEEFSVGRLPKARHRDKTANTPTFDARAALHGVLGVDLTQIHGLGPSLV